MSDRLTDEERSLIDQAMAQRSEGEQKPRRVTMKKPRSYPDRILPKLQATGSRIAPRSAPKRNLQGISILDALKWTFVAQCARLELPDQRPVEERGFGFGMEYILIERAKLGGVKIDGGSGPDQTHEDAEVIAAIVANIPDDLGGKRMALMICEIARSGLLPNWMEGAVPRLEPVNVQTAGRFSGMGKSEVYEYHVETKRVPHPHNKSKMITRTKRTEIKWTPCRWSPSVDEIEATRRRYSDWRRALRYLRDRLNECGMLREVILSRELPPDRPWLG